MAAEEVMESASNEMFEKNCFEESEPEESLSEFPKEIVITVESAENIDCCKVKEIKIKLEFAGDILCVSDPVTVTKCSTVIKLNGVVLINDLSPLFVDKILANPVFFTVYDCTKSAPNEAAAPSPKVEKTGKKASKASTSTVSVPKAQAASQVLGVGNLDIGGFIKGSNIIKETVILESEKKIPLLEAPTWVKLPRLTVVAYIADQSFIGDSVTRFNNIVGITVESVYNLPDNLPEGTVFEAKIPIPSIKDKTDYLIFPNGVTSKIKGNGCRKKWLTLSHLEGNGGKSKYVTELDFSNVINTVSHRFNLNKVQTKTDEKQSLYVHWNTWRSSLMIQPNYNYFFSKLMKYRTWPIEVYPAHKSSPPKTAKSEKKSKSTAAAETPANSNHYTAFLDLSTLIYPGVTKARVAAQLYTYSQTDLINKFGAEFTATASQSSFATVKSRAASERSKASNKETEMVGKDAPGVPVYNKHDLPTFIIVEVEFFKPFVAKREPEYLQEQLKQYVSLKGKINKKTGNLSVTQNSFTKLIKEAAALVTTEYQKFSQKYKDFPLERFNADFQKYMYKLQNFNKINITLESTVLELLSEKYGDLSLYNEKLQNIYIDLVEEMHRITNGSPPEDSESSCKMYTDKLQLYAEEAFEEEEFDLAKEYLLLKISREISNPKHWLHYAALCMWLDDHETAIEAVREALFLNPNHKIGLLMYGLIMTRLKNENIAELCFEVLLSKYPDFVEGWAVLGFFYQNLNNFEGKDVAVQQVSMLEYQQQLLENPNFREDEATHHNELLEENYKNPNRNKSGMASLAKEYNIPESLTWSFLLCPRTNSNLTTANLLLRLGFHEFAVMALSHDMTTKDDDRSPHYLYYLAVSHFLQGRYEETVYHLEEFVKQYGKNYLVWGLLGHCYYKLGNHTNAIACYEYVLECYNRQDDVHLIYLRMGYYYLKARKFPCAKQIFITACKYSPSPRLWKGLGIACFRMKELEDAETAFSEANYLDSRDPENWAYLALTNISLGRLQLFKHCYVEAKKRNLNNPSLTEELECYLNMNLKDIVE